MLKGYVRFQNWLRRSEGQALSEYGVIIALVLVASITALIAFRTELVNMLTALREAMKSR